MKYSVFSLLLVCCSISAPLGAELVIVDDGVSHAPIVISEGASPRTVVAAEHLAEIMEGISGVKPEILHGQPEPLPERAIWVGYQAALDGLFPEVDFVFGHPEEILIAANDNHVVIAGRDRFDPGVEVYDRWGKPIPDIQREYGTINAIYTFLQDYLDVRWLWPGSTGTDIIQKERIAFSSFLFRYHPQIRSRDNIFNSSILSRAGGSGGGTTRDWLRSQRILLDSLVIPGGHGFRYWWDKYHETKPDLFALQPDGTRSGFPGPGRHKMCKANPELWEQWLIEVEAQLKENPTQTVFNAAANDSWRNGYCVCDLCREWDHPDAELRSYVWQGLSQEYVAMSDRQVTLANKLAGMLAAKYPEEDYYVSILAYGPSRPAPIEALPADNVIILSVANFFQRPGYEDPGSPNQTLHRDQFSGWAKSTPKLGWRPNKTRYMASMPHIGIHQTIEDIRFVADNNCMAIYIDLAFENWATRGPLYYVMAQMAWNPYQDGEAMLSDYYQRGFGKAAGAIRDYWNLMEEKFNQSQTERMDYQELFDADFFTRAYEYLDRARDAVTNEPEIYSQRIKFIRIGLDYTQMLTEVRSLMIRFNESGGRDIEAEDEARRIWVEGIKPLANNREFPEALNWGSMRPGHGHNRMGAGVLYPEDLHRKW